MFHFAPLGGPPEFKSREAWKYVEFSHEYHDHAAVVLGIYEWIG